MGSRYKIRDKEGLYFITYTVVGWVDLFIRNEYRDCLIESWQYCVAKKGLNVHAYVIMTNHVHMIVSARDGYNLVNIIRDFKRYSSKELIRLIRQIAESRRVWMLKKFSYEANRVKRGTDHILWKEGYHAIQIQTEKLLNQKLSYIHENPVKAGFVCRPEDFRYSSARNYADEQGEMEVDFLF